MSVEHWHWDQVFEKKPQLWGSTGYPYLWQALQGAIESTYPLDASDAVMRLRLGFQEIMKWNVVTGVPNTVLPAATHSNDESSASYSLETWRARLMPMLARRVHRVMSSETGAEAFRPFSQRLQPFAHAILLKNQLLSDHTLNDYQHARVLASISDDLRKCSDIIVNDIRPCRTSVAALQLFPDVNLAQTTWHDQPKFDPGRELLMFEHVTPISQIRKLCLAVTTVDEILTILWRNLRVAWITKEENRTLTKCGYKFERPAPLINYTEAGILLT